jgi:non-ribosomal peptide synthetase component E (peptide arylation enzyme)
MAKPTRYTPEMFEDYTKKGYWGSKTLSDFWKTNARDCPEREAVVDSRTRLTWREADRWIDRFALGLLERGLKKDQVIVIQLPNCVELCLLRVACERAGLLCLPVLRTLRQREMEYILNGVEAVGVVFPWKFRKFDYLEMIQEIRPRLPNLQYLFMTDERVPGGVISLRKMVEQPLEEKYLQTFLEKTKCSANEFSLIAATSGTTGFPKFVESPICSRIYMGKVAIKEFGLTDKDIIGVFSPAVGGVNHQAYFSSPMVQAKVVMLEHFSAVEAFQLIERERITYAGMVPAQLAMMIRETTRKKYDLRSIRLLQSAGSPLLPQLAMEAEREFGCPIVQTYGSMDSGGMTLHSLNDPVEVRLFTIGRPARGNEVRLIDDAGKETKRGEAGEIQVRGPTLVSGYYKDPEMTRRVYTEEGWYKTGDLGRYDEKGNLLIVGRKKDVIIRGGQNIYPVEIENLLLAHPKVLSVAVVKMPDSLMGEKACAYVVAKDGHAFTFEEMIAFLEKMKVAAYKWPERLEVIHALPMVAEGQKVDKKLLEKDLEEKLKREGQ